MAEDGSRFFSILMIFCIFNIMILLQPFHLFLTIPTLKSKLPGQRHQSCKSLAPARSELLDAATRPRAAEAATSY